MTDETKDRIATVLDWLEERGFTAAERARVAAALAPPLRSFDCDPGEEYQMLFPDDGDGWAMNVHLRTSEPMAIHLFGVFERTPTEEAP